MIRHSVSGKLYWLGNISPAPPRENSPRYPLVNAEVDEQKAALKKDTDELFRLANDLKQKVDQTNENQLSVSVIKATEKIEKLAKSVREKMQANGYCDFVGQ